MRQHLWILCFSIGALVLSACGTANPSVSVSEPWVRAALMTGQGAGNAAMSGTHATTGTHNTAMHTDMKAEGGTSAAYMTLVNRSGTADALVGAASDVAATVELHTVDMKDNVMQMRPVTEIEVPANGQAQLKPGGFHVMLIGLKRDLKVGEEVRLTLTFRNAGTVEVTAPVRQS